MEATQSFAPLAARLAACAAEIRPVDGAEVSWANFMALFVCAILQMLILLCEARAVAAPVARDGDVRLAPAVRPGHPAMPGAGRAPRLARAEDAPSTPTALDAALAGSAEPPTHNAQPAWVLAWPAPCWRPPRLGIVSRKAALPSQVRHVLFVAIS